MVAQFCLCNFTYVIVCVCACASVLTIHNLSECKYTSLCKYARGPLHYSSLIHTADKLQNAGNPENMTIHILKMKTIQCSINIP